MTTTQYFWDPIEDNIVHERDDANGLETQYTTEPSTFGNVISQVRAGVESQLHFDALGSTVALTDDNQQVTDTRAYSAFGEVTHVIGNTILSLEYAGRKGYYAQGAVEEHLTRRRTYTSRAGRWLSVDPAAPLNTWETAAFYVYSNNNPVIFADPSGLAYSLTGPIGRPPSTNGNCTTTTRSTLFARCEFHKSGTMGKWSEDIDCPGADAESCCHGRARRWGWDVVSSALGRKTVIKTTCQGSSPGAVSLCQKPVLTPVEGGIVIIVVLIGSLPLWPQTDIRIDIDIGSDDPDELKLCRSRECVTIGHSPWCEPGSCVGTCACIPVFAKGKRVPDRCECVPEF